MIPLNKKQLFLKIAARALVSGLEATPIVGAVIKISYDCWKALKEHQDAIAVQERIEQLEASGALSPDEARQAADAAITELEEEGQKIPQERADAVRDVISVMPAAIRERTKATLQHARTHGTAAATVLPVTSNFQNADREEFYQGLFPQRRPQFRPGDSVPNYNPDWKLERLIGAGGFGEVWLARNQRMKKQPVAVKFCQDPVHSKLMQREANNLVTLTEKLPLGTPNIVGLIDAHLTNQPYWLMFEYIDGGTLEHRMRLGQMDLPTAWQLFEPILQGISQVHEQGIVHRDLKPANILLANGTDPRIADFGIGKVLAEQKVIDEKASKTFTTIGYGTANYMSPEQAEGLPAHPTDDVYSLGIILYQMLAGHLKPLRFPYEVQQLSAPSSIANIIQDCVFLPRENRFKHARTLLAELRSEVVKHATKPVVTAASTSSPPSAVPKQQTHRVSPSASQSKGSTEQEKRLAEEKEQKRIANLVQYEHELKAKHLAEEQAKKQFKQNIGIAIGAVLRTIGIAIGAVLSILIIISITLKSMRQPTPTDSVVQFNAKIKAPSVTQKPTIKQPTISNENIINTNIEAPEINIEQPDINTENANENEINNRYINNEDGTVTDKHTKLMWQRCSVGQDWTGIACTKEASVLTIENTMPNYKQKDWPSFSGYNDWRVPNVEELFSLGVIDQETFPNTPLSWFWTASFSDNRPAYTWIVNATNGEIDDYARSRNNYVRLVRGGFSINTAVANPVATNENETLMIPQQVTQQEVLTKKKANDRYIINNNGTVIDQQTGLMWQACSFGQTWYEFTCINNVERMTWLETNAYTQSYWPTFAGHKNWRLPTSEELRTLIYCSSGKPKTWNDSEESCDGEYQSPTIDSIAFPKTCTISKYWTSSRHRNDYNQVWYVKFDEGLFFYANKENTGAVRLVRNLNR